MIKDNKLDVSVIIPCYNSKKTIEKCLRSIVNQSFKNFEIIVVDSSNDNTPEIITAKIPQVNLIRLDEKALHGKARNIGIRNAKGRIIAFTDSDCIVDENWIELIINSHSPNCHAVAGSVLNGNPHHFWGDMLFILEFQRESQHSPSRKVSIAATCNMSYKREVFKKNIYKEKVRRQKAYMSDE